MTHKSIPRLGNIVHNLTHFPMDGEGNGGLPHIILITPVIDVLYNDTMHYQYELIKFRSKMFRHVHPCSVVHVYEWGINFASYYVMCILPSYSRTRTKLVSQYENDIIFIRFLLSMVCYVFQLFLNPPPLIPSNSKASFNKPSVHLSQSH